MLKKLILLFGIILILPLVLAETTFFEGKNFITGQTHPQGGGIDGDGMVPPACDSLWICEEWSGCSNRVRSRSCININDCVSNEKPPLLLSCLEPLPNNRINGCVTFSNLNILIGGWKLDIYRFDLLDEGIRKWKQNTDC